MNEAWKQEPDRWDGELMCILRHKSMKHLCGYVGVTKDHPLYGVHYSDKVTAPDDLLTEEINIDEVPVASLFCADAEEIESGVVPLDLCIQVHGGLTYSNGNGKYPREEEGVWWFGFDCAHAGDFSPGSPLSDGVYRDMDYVKNQVIQLARQIAKWRD